MTALEKTEGEESMIDTGMEVFGSNGSSTPIKNPCVPEHLKNAKYVTYDEFMKNYNNREPHILDSGDRTEFASGAVRDMREGKGRCDLLPLDVVCVYCDNDPIFLELSNFQETNDINRLYRAIRHFVLGHFKDDYGMLLEVAKHFEEGAKKYGDNNWRKGIPVNVYIDSGVRHYLKYLRGDTDEPHDRAFCWNILCAIWTAVHMPELNPYAKKETGNESN